MIPLGVFPLLADQIVLVRATDMNASGGVLQRYACEARCQAVGEPIPVNLGRHGLGWGEGDVTLGRDGPQKREGDGRAPAGVFRLTAQFGEAAVGNFPHLETTPSLICVDDRTHLAYNAIVEMPDPAPVSFEWMRRTDHQYRHGVVVAHNPARIPGHGSCIFLHIEKAPGASTAGCTSMTQAALRELIDWLDAAQKPLLIQIPESALPALHQRFKGLE